MSDNIKEIVPEVAVSCEAKIVTIELICSDAYSARVLFDDITSKVSSGAGLKLLLRGNLVPEAARPA